MADITDKQLATFGNEKIRVAADLYAQGFYRARAVTDAWDALGLTDKFPNDTSVLIDGSETDGRSQITGADVHAMITILKAFVASTEASENAILQSVLKVAVNTQR